MKMIDETGHTYGTLTVIKPAKDKQGKSAWLCRCKCGNTKIVRGSDLRGGKITTCGKGCPYKSAINFIDETGNKYGELTVLYRGTKSPSGKVRWHCRCSCGNELDVEGASLRNGRTKSCGCKTIQLIQDKTIKNLTNQTFEYLTVKSFAGVKNHEARWNCQCRCGKEIVVPGVSLLSGNTQSCGCKRESRGETKIRHILESQEVLFQQEYSFDDLRTKNNLPFRYDFAIFNRQKKLIGLIEFHGQQHYQPVDLFGGEEKFIQRQQYDKIKEQYCKDNHIPLLIIKYDVHDIEKQIEQFLKEISYEN